MQQIAQISKSSWKLVLHSTAGQKVVSTFTVTILHLHFKGFLLRRNQAGACNYHKFTVRSANRRNILQETIFTLKPIVVSSQFPLSSYSQIFSRLPKAPDT